MRICFISRRFFPAISGMSIYAANLLRELVAAGHDVTLVSQYYGGDHTHLPFGEGDMDIPACLDALEEIGFARLVCVELSRESHRADRMIPQSLDWLRHCREGDTR